MAGGKSLLMAIAHVDVAVDVDVIDSQNNISTV